MSDNKTEMKIYKRLIKPMMLVPTSSNDYSPKQVQIEPEEKWYPEENRETLVQKYKYLETAFETLVFEDKYEEIKIPEIVRCKDCKYRDPEDMKCDCGHDIRWQIPRPDDWFCADGGRR